MPTDDRVNFNIRIPQKQNVKRRRRKKLPKYLTDRVILQIIENGQQNKQQQQYQKRLSAKTHIPLISTRNTIMWLRNLEFISSYQIWLVFKICLLFWFFSNVSKTPQMSQPMASRCTMPRLMGWLNKSEHIIAYWLPETNVPLYTSFVAVFCPIPRLFTASGSLAGCGFLCSIIEFCFICVSLCFVFWVCVCVLKPARIPYVYNLGNTILVYGLSDMCGVVRWTGQSK